MKLCLDLPFSKSGTFRENCIFLAKVLESGILWKCTTEGGGGGGIVRPNDQ